MVSHPGSSSFTGDEVGDVTIGGGDSERDACVSEGADDVGVCIEELHAVDVGLRLKE